MSKQSLDEKLKAFYAIARSHDKVAGSGYAIDQDGWIEQVRQAFTDEGYMTLAEIGTIAKMYFDNKLMTGQEFYDRFVEECKKLHPNNPSIFDPVYDAARIAAGLQETEE